MKIVYAIRLGTTLPISALLTASLSAAADSFDSRRAFQELEAQVAFGPRPPGSAAHEKLLDYLVAGLEVHADQVRLQPFSRPGHDGSGEVRFTNVIAEFSVGSPRRILLGAHWDTRPFAEKEPEPANRGKPIPGANDGASGVAVLMEVARNLAEKPPPPGVGVDIVLFDGEDWGRTGHLEEYFVGSRYFAANLDGYRPEFGIILDMVGDREQTFFRERYSELMAGPVVEMVWSKARLLGLDSFIDSPGQAIMDDHLPLLEAGILVIDIIDFDYPFWHTLQDTPDKCSPSSLEAVGVLVLSIIYGL
ncbi:M28 family peptidase [candidate division KSB1 bacterium]